MLRISLFGPPNRRKQPERYAPFVLKFIEKCDMGIIYNSIDKRKIILIIDYRRLSRVFMKKIFVINLITLVCIGCASFNISGDLTRLDLPIKQEINKNTNEGTVIARIQDEFEIVRTRIKDGRFKIVLNELSPDLLKPLQDIYNDDWNLQISDPEARVAYLGLYVTFGAYFDVTDGIKKETFWLIEKNGKGYYDRYYYIYSDRRVSAYGEGEGDSGYTNGLIFKYPNASVKRVLDINLKRGWNRIKYFIFYNGKDIIQKTENTKEVFQRGPFVGIIGVTKYIK
jgi:hypothetical protein